jgi:hypothetical protein
MVKILPSGWKGKMRAPCTSHTHSVPGQVLTGGHTEQATYSTPTPFSSPKALFPTTCRTVPRRAGGHTSTAAAPLHSHSVVGPADARTKGQQGPCAHLSTGLLEPGALPIVHCIALVPFPYCFQTGAGAGAGAGPAPVPSWLLSR